jgi:Peptidase A4 family
MNRSKRLRAFLAASVLPTLWLLSAPVAGAAATANPCGVGEAWLQPTSVAVLPDGGQIDTYDSGARVPVPPKGFSPMTASDAALATYGFPPRPTDVVALSAWQSNMTTWTWTPDTGLCATDKRATTLVSSNWAGYLATSPTPVFIATQGDYHQAAKGSTSCSSPQEVSWVGIGGQASPTSGLIQDGTGIDTTGALYAWYEYLYFDSNGVMHGIFLTKMPSVTVHAGDRIHSYVVHQTSGSGQTTFYVADNTTGTSKSVIQDLSSSYYDGRTAEWIDERLTVGGGLAPLTNFGNINWTNTKAQKSNATWYNLGNLTYDKVDLTIPHALAYPGALTSSTTFTDTWYNCS